MTGAAGPRRGASSAAAALIAALAAIDPDTTGPCFLCRAEVRLGELSPLVPPVPGLLICPGCRPVVSDPPTPDPVG